MSLPVRRVLIVEDEVILALDFSDAVAELGYHIIGPALSLDEGMRLARSESIDCALLDVNLGHGQTSQPIAEALRQQGVRLAFLTAYDREQIAFANEDETVMRKPPGLAVLHHVIDFLCK
ncbi:hypothetical protein A9995_14165 [Erythrobacter sp. QSSC1-22B]|uniref:response regulator n=1 Tax=Erythrobacter sp. QSSC1-22B TaxID=1860125 RepID=UPI00080530F1|nr:response regulator [Erythrobacter sp. QSSC1-22B]OBX17938.1 hypothetical protein A9995_14165 [Erythrobacter sp. QSSC1-22B]